MAEGLKIIISNNEYNKIVDMRTFLSSRLSERKVIIEPNKMNIIYLTENKNKNKSLIKIEASVSEIVEVKKNIKRCSYGQILQSK